MKQKVVDKHNCTWSSSGNVTSWKVTNTIPKDWSNFKNQLIPISIDALNDTTMVFKWKDGDTVTVVCDKEDTFSVDVGYDIALTYKLFGGKHEFKNRWLKKIMKLVKFHYTDMEVKAERHAIKEKKAKTLRAKVK